MKLIKPLLAIAVCGIIASGFAHGWEKAAMNAAVFGAAFLGAFLPALAKRL